jgi:cyclic beta-1,2-glucan synthetase
MWLVPLISYRGFSFTFLHISSACFIFCVAGIDIVVRFAIYFLVDQHDNSFEECEHLSERMKYSFTNSQVKTWAFFEKFMGDEDNWLPPDNYQEEPVERIAHRTSPTNMGLVLLSNLICVRFQVHHRIAIIGTQYTNTIGTMQRMERFRGHFYNWYDTISLQPLHPRYISTVDSGNLAGHLLTLKQGLIALPHDKIIRTDVFDGILDTASVLAEKAPGKCV